MNGVKTAQQGLGERGCRRPDCAVDLQAEQPADRGWHTDESLRRRPAQGSGNFHFDKGGGNQRSIVVSVEPGDEFGAVFLLANGLDDGSGVEVDHQRSSSRILASAAAASTSPSPSCGGRGTGPPPVGGVARPAATSL